MSPEEHSPTVRGTDEKSPDNRFTHVLEKEKRFSESLLWEAQRKYFERTGIDAWRTGVVPHYVTNNPRLAASYAEVVLGYVRDCCAIPGLINPGEPVYIVELGSGSGRFGFFLLKALTELLGRSQVAHVPLRYVMTDLTESNLKFYRSHPALQPFLEQDKLDFALFDLEGDAEVRLESSGKVLTAGSLTNPLIVIANYVFDSTRHDAFLIKNDRLFEHLISVYSDVPEVDLDAADVFDHLALTHTNAPAPSDYYPEAEFNAILQHYTHTLKETILLFPAGAIRCLQRLAGLSAAGVLVLSADKGEAEEEFLDGQREARFVMHGSFSLAVNYHAIKEYCLGKGSYACTYAHGYNNLNISAFGLGSGPIAFPETRLAYDRALGSGAVDDFLLLQQRFREHQGGLEAAHLLALFRLSGWDPAVMQELLPALSGQVENLSSSQRADLLYAVQQTWDNYFHIGEQPDLAFDLGSLLFQMDQYEQALHFFSESFRLYGADWQTVWNQGLCYCALQNPAEGAECFSRAMKTQADSKAGGLQAKNAIPKP